MGQWFRAVVVAWLISSAMIGVALVIVTLVRPENVQEYVLGTIYASAGTALLSALPTLVAAAVLYGPAKVVLSGARSRTLWVMAIAGLVAFIGLASRLSRTIGDAQYSVVFSMWVAALAASILAVQAARTRFNPA